MYSKKTIHILSILVVLSLIRPNHSAALDLQSFKPYLGLEYSQRSLNMVEGYGKGLFVKRLPQGNVFFGLKLNDYIGIEAGYLFSQAATRTTYSTEGSQIFGSLVAGPGEFFVADSTINLFGPHINFQAYLPIGTTPFAGIGSLGFSLITLKARFKPLGDIDDLIYPPDAVEILTRHFSSTKLVSHIMGGLGYQMTNSINIRFLMGLETTSRFKNITPQEVSSFKMNLKNNSIANLGFTYSF